MCIRILAAAAVLVSAAVHLKLWFDGVRHQDVIGPAFMLNAVGGVVIAGLLAAVAALDPGLAGARLRGVHARRVHHLGDGRAVRRAHEHWTGG